MQSILRIPAHVGQILKSRRLQLGMTQKNVGGKVGLKQSTVSAFENDASGSSIETLYKVLSALDLELVVRDRGVSRAKAKTEW